MNGKIKGAASVMSAGCLWGFMSLFVNGMAGLGLYAMDVIFVRVLISAVIMSLIIFFKDKSLFRIKLKDIWCFLGTGVLSLTMFNFFYFTNIRLTSPGVAAVLMYTSPVFILFLSAVFFKERLTAVKFAACVLTFTGCALVGGIFGQGITLKGLVFGLMSGFGYGLYSIFGRFASDKGYTSLTITLYTFIFAVFGTLPFMNSAAVFEMFKNNSPAKVFAILSGAVSWTVVPYILYTLGLKYIETGEAGVIAAIEVVVASLVGYFVFNETFSFAKIIGIALVIASIAMMNTKKERKKDGV